MFITETDTEVIPKLCKFVFERLPERVPFPKVRPSCHERCSLSAQPPTPCTAYRPAHLWHRKEGKIYARCQACVKGTLCFLSYRRTCGTGS
jgi:hypothetical protein